jgi:glycosyltransferase involved in cell wall biosynthesis
MKIVLDALGLPRFGGARSSAIGWLTALAEYGPEHHYWVFVSRHEPELTGFSNLKQLVAPVANRFLVRMWAQAAIPFFLWRAGADLYHATKNLSVIGVSCPVVITVNDLTHVLLARYYPWLDNIYWRWIQPFMFRRATRIVAISESTRQGLIDCYGLNERKVEVIYPSYHPRYRQAASEAARAAVRNRYGLPKSYVLYVGGLGLHKNVSTLVSSFDAIAGRVPHGLVLVGGNYHTSSDQTLFRAVAERGRDRRIWLLDAVPEEDMPAIYQMADLFVLPSLNEGFGLTLLEAMASGVPVVASRAGAIPEVVGDAGCLMSATKDQKTLADTLLALLDSPLERAVLKEKGLARAAGFSWEITATKTLALYAVCQKALTRLSP